MITKIKKIVNTEDKIILLSNYFSLSLLQAITYILPLLTIPYLVRVLGVEKFGLVAFAQVFIIFFNIFVDYGFNLSATREISIYRNNKEKITEIFSSVMLIKLILLIVSYIFLNIIIFNFDKFANNVKLYNLTFLWVIGQAMFPVWYFQGMEKMKYITMVNITSKLIFTILIFVIVKNESDYTYVPLLNGFGFIIGGILSLGMVYKNFHQKFKFQSIKTLKNYFYDSSQFFLSRIASAGYSNINTFLAGVLLSPSFVTYYYLANKIITVSVSIFDPLVQTVYPYLSKNFKIKFFIRLICFVVIISFLWVGVIYLFENYLSILLLKEISILFINILNILLYLIPISLMYVMLGAPLLLARGYKKQFNNSIIYGFIIHGLILSFLYVLFLFNIIVNEALLYMFAYSLIFSKSIVLFIRLYYVKKFRVIGLK